MAHAAPANDLRVPALFDFSSHIVLVSGGATGLGEMAAQAYVQNGARVIIASRKESELKKTCERLNSLGPGKCEYVVADLGDKKGCVGLCEEVKKRVGRLTVLISESASFRSVKALLDDWFGHVMWRCVSVQLLTGYSAQTTPAQRGELIITISLKADGINSWR